MIWTPAHSFLVSNNIADYYALNMSRREVEEAGVDSLTPITTYKDTITMYRENRQTLPEPHHSLTRRDQTIIRGIQAGSLAHPTLLHKMYPRQYSELCPFCQTSKGTLQHVILECTALKAPIPNAPSPSPLPLNERWEILRLSPSANVHASLAARGLELLARYGAWE